MKGKKKSSGAGAFLNVDVEVVSDRGLPALAREMGESCAVLFNGRIGGSGKRAAHLLVFETARFSRSANLKSVMKDLLSTLKSLSTEARREWDSARSRVFDIGFDGEAEGSTMLQTHVEPELLGELAELGAGFAVTCYRREAAGD